MATIDSGRVLLTLINVFIVKPQDQQKPVALLVEAIPAGARARA